MGAKFDAVYKEQVRLESLLAKAKTEFAKSKIGATRFRHYSEQRKRMEKLEAELLKNPVPEKRKEPKT